MFVAPVRNATIICPGHSRPVVDISYSQVTSHGYFLLSACLDTKPMLRDGITGDWIGTFEGHTGAVWSAQFNQYASHVLTGSADYTARLWDSITGGELLCLPHKTVVKSVAFNDDSYKAYTAAGKSLFMWDLPTQARVVGEGSTASEFDCPDDVGTLNHLTAIPQSSLVLSSTDSSDKLLLWDSRTLTCVRSIKTAGPVSQLTLDHSTQMATVACGKQVMLLDQLPLSDALSADSFNQYAVIKVPQATENIKTAAYDVARKRLVVAWSESVCGIDTETSDTLFQNKGHIGNVHSIKFRPDGEAFASGSEGGNFLIYNWNDSVMYN